MRSAQSATVSEATSRRSEHSAAHTAALLGILSLSKCAPLGGHSLGACGTLGSLSLSTCGISSLSKCATLGGLSLSTCGISSLSKCATLGGLSLGTCGTLGSLSLGTSPLVRAVYAAYNISGQATRSTFSRSMPSELE